MTDSSKEIKILTIQFDLPIQYEEIPLLRGVVIKLSNLKSDLFHNHGENGVIYRYPLIQYKRLRHNAALISIGEACNVIHDIFENSDFSIKLGKRSEKLKVEKIKSLLYKMLIGGEFSYRLENWLPLNQENYKLYRQTKYFQQKAEILEKILTGNILAFCEGIGLNPQKNILSPITRIAREKVIPYRGQLMQAYDIDFRTNIFLPDYIGLGKGTGIGYGMLIKKNIRK